MRYIAPVRGNSIRRVSLYPVLGHVGGQVSGGNTAVDDRQATHAHARVNTNTVTPPLYRDVGLYLWTAPKLGRFC